MARLRTKLKVLGALMALPFGAGFLMGRYGDLITERWCCNRRRKALRSKLQQIGKEKGRLEEEMEKLDKQSERPQQESREKEEEGKEE